MSPERLVFDDIELEVATADALADNGQHTVNKSTNEAFKEIVLGQLVDRLKELKIIDDTEESESQATELLRWADIEMQRFYSYVGALGMPLPDGIKSYMRENSMTPREWSELYHAEVEERTAQVIAEIMAYYKPEIDELVANVQADAEREGCDGAQTKWRIYQATQAKLAYIETEHMMAMRQKIQEEVNSELGEQEALPSLGMRYAQLEYMHEKQRQLRESGESYRLVPIPYKDIMQRIVPEFSPQDVSPKEWPNYGRGLAEFHLGPEYLKLLRGRDGMFPTEYRSSYYAKISGRADVIGNYGLALFSEAQLNGDDPSKIDLATVRHADNNSNVRLDRASLPESLVWAMLVADKHLRGRRDLDEDIKMVIPDYIPAVSDKSAALLSIYIKDKSNPHDRRVGIAINAISEHDAAKGNFDTLKAVI